MKAIVCPGQGSQYSGMGKQICDGSDTARAIFVQADDILGFSLSTVMFEGSQEQLTQTDIAQPAIYLDSVAQYFAKPEQFDMCAGHSLGEFSALCIAGALSFEDGLRLVWARAKAMQQACQASQGTMAAVLGLADELVEQVCSQINEHVVVAANYNCPGQLVISGGVAGIALASEKLKLAGAKRVIGLSVGGAFHSPLMEPARKQLEQAILATKFNIPNCVIYQNVDAKPTKNPDQIRINLIAQLTAPVRWTQTVQQMIADGVDSFVECGPGNVLQGLIKKTDKNAQTAAYDN